MDANARLQCRQDKQQLWQQLAMAKTGPKKAQADKVKSKMADESLDQETMQAAAALVLEQDRKRKRRAEIRARKRHRRQRKEQLEAVQRMHHSVEVIKRCMVLIAGVMLVGLVVLVWTIVKVKNDVAVIERQVDHVRESLRHPMQSLGSTFGRELDQKLNAALGIQDQDEQ